MTLADDKWVRIMCDFGAEPIWDRQGAPAYLYELPVSEELRQRLANWQATFESEGDTPHPPGSISVAAFSAEGIAIARAVKAALPDWTVVYFDEEKAAPSPVDRPRSYFEYEV